MGFIIGAPHINAKAYLSVCFGNNCNRVHPWCGHIIFFYYSLSSTLSCRLKRTRLRGWAAGFTTGSMYIMSLVSFSVSHTASRNTSGYYCCGVCLVSATAATSTTIFNTLSYIAVSLPRSGTPFPLITSNSAWKLSRPTVTSQVNRPFTRRGPVGCIRLQYSVNRGRFSHAFSSRMLFL